MEKYGFVYIWYDRKHKRYYIGCHWGHEDDRYICSSSWIKQAYKHRPQDFKRRVLSRVYSNRKELLLEEHKWLLLIKSEEYKNRYYNLCITHPNHWSTDKQKYKTVAEKVSESWKDPEIRARKISKKSETMKQKFQDPEYRKLYDDSRVDIDYHAFSQAGVDARRGKPAWNKGVSKSDEVKAKISQALKGRPNGRKGVSLSEAHKMALRKPKLKKPK